MVDYAEKAGQFARRLDYALEVCRLSNRDFAAKVDPERGQQIVNNWRKRGRIGWPSVGLVSEILGGQINMVWLNEGTGTPGPPPDVLRTVETARMFAVAADAEEQTIREMIADGALRPATAASSQPARIDPGKLAESVRFLEQQFALWGRDFVASERTHLIAAVYEALATEGKSNLVSLSQWLAHQLSVEDSNVGQGEAGSAGGHDRKRAQGGA